jgi:protein tyrosine phosphatase (PTP) superfamily phosphohydrolase (DUF442 family)
VAQVSFKNNVGVYSVTLPEKAKFEPAAVKKAVGTFTLDSVELKITGDVSKDDKGLWLTAPSGTKLLLANRPKKDDKDQPPDVVAEIEKAIKEGKTTFAVAGAVKEEKDAATVQLESASAVEKKKEGM